MKDAGDGKGTAKDLLDKIASLESVAEQSFMHRFLLETCYNYIVIFSLVFILVANSHHVFFLLLSDLISQQI